MHTLCWEGDEGGGGGVRPSPVKGFTLQKSTGCCRMVKSFITCI